MEQDRSLELNAKAFSDKLEELLDGQHAGKHALFKDGVFIDSFATLEEALNFGYDKYDLQPFFVHQVERAEASGLSSRRVPLASCR